MQCDMTAVILTKNEEKNIANCLDSIKGLVRRIVIVDSGSTDKTLTIASSYNVDIYHHEWIHYANQFNWALDNTNINTKWVFRIDADEVVPTALAEELRIECNAHSDDGVTGMEMPFKMRFMGRYLKHGGAYPVWKITVFKYGFGRFEDRAMGEHVVLRTGSLIRLTNDCLHHDFKDLGSWIDKHNAYASREVSDYYALRTGKVAAAGLQGNAEISKKMRDSLYYQLPRFIRARLYYWFRYYIQLGFLDGEQGRIYAFLQAYWYRYLVDAKLLEYELKRSQKAK